MIQDPSAARVARDLTESDFLSGVNAGRWCVVDFAFPILDFAITATDLDGKEVTVGFRAELSNYPGQAPMVRIWDHANKCKLAAERRPKGNRRLDIAFQVWGEDTVYRPWERMTGPHGSNAANNPHLAWRPDRRLSFIFRDLHAILNSNARARRIRAAT
jgi:hypothetical protein